MIRVVYIFLVYIISATSVYAEKKTTDAENLEFSKSCFNQTKNFLQPKFKEGMTNLIDLNNINNDRFGDDLNISREYSYWPSEIKKINANGATIETKIKISFEFTSNDNGGWGEKKKHKNSNLFRCVFQNVKKGEFTKPDFFSTDVGSINLIYAYQWGEECNPLNSNTCSAIDTYVKVTKSTKASYISKLNDTWYENYSVNALSYFSEK